MTCPVRYVYVRSYGAPDFAAARRPPLPALLLLPKLLRVPHFGQLTREICPRLVTETTTWPRSSPHTAHSFSTRSPTAKVCFSMKPILLVSNLNRPLLRVATTPL